MSAAIRYRKLPETPVPIQLVDLVQAGVPLLDRTVQRATPTEIRNASANTIVEWPSENQKPDAQRPLALAHQLAGRVVDRRDVVGVERVAQAERVGGHPDADRERPGRPRR